VLSFSATHVGALGVEQRVELGRRHRGSWATRCVHVADGITTALGLETQSTATLDTISLI
jgi:hypothetical protein